jgi:hypothetical protein
MANLINKVSWTSESMNNGDIRSAVQGSLSSATKHYQASVSAHSSGDYGLSHQNLQHAALNIGIAARIAAQGDTSFWGQGQHPKHEAERIQLSYKHAYLS